MTVLVGCEESGKVRDALLAQGIDAVSCDLKPSRSSLGEHLQCDLREALKMRKWSGFIVFPDCTYVCGSGIHWNKRVPERQKKTDEGVAFARFCWEQDIEKVVLENPVGILSRPENLGPPTQIIQPHQFGHDASKATCLWIRGVPKLVKTWDVPPRIVDGKKRWGNQTDSGQNRLGPSETRARDRSETYTGIAVAIAVQMFGVLR